MLYIADRRRLWLPEHATYRPHSASFPDDAEAGTKGERIMHETLRRRILRSLETLPEAKLYQVLDYIEFLESQYARTAPEAASGLQKLAERLEDGLRRRTLSPSSLREAFQLISAADRVLGSVAEAGREILADLQGGAESAEDREHEAREGGAADAAVPAQVPYETGPTDQRG